MSKKNGHYCKVCGQYKSNESFSGKGHNVHFCKKCEALSPAERSVEMTMTQLMNLPWHLSQEQKSWLKGLQKDKRPEIAETAKTIYAERFPHAERNERKKQLHIREMKLTIQGELWDEYGDEYDAQLIFTIYRKQHTLSCTQGDDTDMVDLPSKEAIKLLNRIVNQYEIFCWEEDFSHSKSEIWEDDMFGDDADENDMEDEPMEEAPPSWIAEVSYLNGESQSMRGYDIPYRINDLVTELLQYFEAEEDAELWEDEEE